MRPVALLLCLIAAIAVGVAQGQATSPDAIATFTSSTTLEAFLNQQAITIIAENVTSSTITFHFTGPNATLEFAAIDGSTSEERLSRYGILQWSLAPTTTSTIAPTTTTMAPTAPPGTFTPVNPAAPHILYELYFDLHSPLSTDAVASVVAAVAQTTTSRLVLSEVWWVNAEVPNMTAPTGNTVQQTRLIRLRVLNPPGNAPEGASTETGEYATVLLINTNLMKGEARLIQTLGNLLLFTATPNSPPYTLADAAAEGGKVYSNEKLRFMGALIATLVILSALLLGGWVRTQQLVAADLAQRAARAQYETVQRLMDGPSSPVSAAASPGGKPVPSTPSPNRPKRSVSFHHTAVPTTTSATAGAARDAGRAGNEL